MKTILVLANKPITGSEWIAEHGNSFRDPHSHRWHTAHDAKSLEQVLRAYFYNVNTNSGIDVEGYILPEFQHNPERAQMLELLISHKRRVNNASAEKFVTNVLVPNKEKLLQIGVLEKNGIELNRSPKQWIGTREEYIKIPVKDPNTVYSITA